MTDRFSMAFDFGLLMREIDRLVRTTLDARLEPMGLSGAQWRPLLVLHRQGAQMTQTALARALNIEAPTLVRLLDRLGEKGWIERLPCPGDRRARLIALTPRAHGLCAEINKTVDEFRVEWFRDVSDDELRHCNAILDRIRSRLMEISP